MGFMVSPAQAAPHPVNGESSGGWLDHIEIVGKGPERSTYYYTNVVLTGTHVPVVIRKYKGQMEIVSGGLLQGVSYNLGELEGAHAGNASAILRNDPAIQ